MAIRLLDELRACGVELRADGNRLWFRPVDRVTPELLDRLREHKPELLAVLRHEAVRLSTRADPANFTVEAARAEARQLGLLRESPHELSTTAASQPTRFRWIVGDALARLPEPIQGLVCSRSGWTPTSWAAYLRLRAARCDDRHDGLAERYREAARLLGTAKPPAEST